MHAYREGDERAVEKEAMYDTVQACNTSGLRARLAIRLGPKGK
jgi:hypothetical protein